MINTKTAPPTADPVPSSGVSDDDLLHVVETQKEPLLRLALRTYWNREAAEDIFHQAVLEFWQNRKSIKDVEHAICWLRRCVRCRALDAARRTGRDVSLSAFNEDWHTDPVDYEEERRTRILETARCILELLRDHPDWLKVIQLCELDGLTRKEAADQIGVSERQVYRRLDAAKDYLKNATKEWDL